MKRPSYVGRWVALVLAVALLAALGRVHYGANGDARARRRAAAALVAGAGPVRSQRPASPARGTPQRDVWTARSVRRRVIRAVAVGSGGSEAPTLVFGCIHGNECAGSAVVTDLLRDPPPRGIGLWVVADLNPDGRALGTRQNARGVDLNRNFRWRWHAGQSGGLQYPGPFPLSEPESRFAHFLVVRLQPEITIWFHQPLGLVDMSGGASRIEWRFARLVGLPARRLPRYGGSATTWQNHAFPGATAFVVELPPGPLDAASAEREADAIIRLSRG